MPKEIDIKLIKVMRDGEAAGTVVWGLPSP